MLPGRVGKANIGLAKGKLYRRIGICRHRYLLAIGSVPIFAGHHGVLARGEAKLYLTARSG